MTCGSLDINNWNVAQPGELGEDRLLYFWIIIIFAKASGKTPLDLERQFPDCMRMHGKVIANRHDVPPHLLRIQLLIVPEVEQNSYRNLHFHDSPKWTMGSENWALEEEHLLACDENRYDILAVQDPCRLLIDLFASPHDLSVASSFGIRTPDEKFFVDDVADLAWQRQERKDALRGRHWRGFRRIHACCLLKDFG